jgi:hypothetical protein
MQPIGAALACSVAIIGTSDAPKVRSGGEVENQCQGAHTLSSWRKSKLARV